MRTFTCPKCAYQMQARAKEMAHPCPANKTATGRKRMTPMKETP